MTLCEREPWGERAQSRLIWSVWERSAPAGSGVQNRSIWWATIGVDRDWKTAL
jgi:hypothetical protein